MAAVLTGRCSYCWCESLHSARHSDRQGGSTESNNSLFGWQENWHGTWSVCSL